MAKLTKNRKRVIEKIDKSKLYTLKEAVQLVKEVAFTKFDGSVDIHVRLGVDPRKADQALRGAIVLPHGTGRKLRVMVFTTPEYEEVAKKAGADYVGLDEYIQKIQQGWLEFDVAIATPNVMPKIARLGRILGPRNMMPNPKEGTVSEDLETAIKQVKNGIRFKVDKFGIIHSTIGRVSFPPEHLYENAAEFIKTLIKMKPPTAKGTYLKSIYLTCTMGPSIPVDPKSVVNL